MEHPAVLGVKPGAVTCIKFGALEGIQFGERCTFEPKLFLFEKFGATVEEILAGKGQINSQHFQKDSRRR